MPGPGARDKQREADKSHCWEMCSCPAQSRLRRAWPQGRLLLEGVTLWVLTLLMTSCVTWDQQPNLSEPQSSRPNVGATPTVFFSVMSSTKMLCQLYSVSQIKTHCLLLLCSVMVQDQLEEQGEQ